MRLALFQPDIPQNCGAIMRLGACLGAGVDIIEPCGFLWDEKRVRRSGMDYIDLVDVVRHVSWEAFLDARQNHRLILLTTKGAVPYLDFTYSHNDILLLGRESSGVPDYVHDRATARVIIPMQPPARSLNISVSAGIVLSEALRQTA